MLPNSISFTTTIDSVPVVFTKRSEQNGQSRYTGEYEYNSAKRQLELIIKHTRPVNNDSKSSSLMRLKIDYYNADGDFQNSKRAWTVVECEKFNTTQAKFAESLLKDLSSQSSVRDEYFGGSY